MGRVWVAGAFPVVPATSCVQTGQWRDTNLTQKQRDRPGPHRLPPQQPRRVGHDDPTLLR